MESLETQTQTLSSRDASFLIFDWFLYQQSEDYADWVDAEATALRYHLFGAKGMERVY